MKKLLLSLFSFFLILVLFVPKNMVFADHPDPTYLPTPKVYELDKDTSYKRENTSLISGNTAYGKKSIGSLTVTGAIFDETTYNDMTAYMLKGDITVGFSYSNDYEIDTTTKFIKDEDNWYLVSDSAKEVADWDLDGKMKSGAFLILTSEDGKDYDYACDVKTDFFANYSLSTYSDLFSFSAEELKDGLYVKVLIAYKMEVRTEDNFIGDKYETHRYVEEYDFYLSYEKNPIVIRNIDNRSDVSTVSNVEKGFIVDFSGYTGEVKVKKPNGSEVNAKDLQTFTEKGKYTITAETSMGTEFSSNIEVVDGLEYTEINPTVYESENDTGYKAISSNKISGNTVFNSKSHTTIKIGSECNLGKKSGKTAYGVMGDDLFFYISFNQDEDYLYNGWSFVNDEWGRLVDEKIDGISISEIGSGAIVIQTSTDGIEWNDVDKSQFSDGLKTTNFSNLYGSYGDVAIYTPSARDVFDGKFYRILYGYEVKNNKDIKNYLEEYVFYICYDDLDAIAIHNLSVDSSMFSDDVNQTEIEMLIANETMRNNDYTTTGFKVDSKVDKYNINASITYKHNGKTISEPSDKTFTEDGCYEIEIISSIGTKKNTTIYVDTMTNEEALDYYFGDSFIKGKRIFSYDIYPMFEGGLTSYYLAEVDEYHKPLIGVITNKTTGTVTKIDDFIAGETVLTEPGKYNVKFTTWDDKDNIKSGDIRTFTFNFEIIEEGTAPGPIVNQSALIQNSSETISNAKLVYYGVTVHSASVGNVTLVFNSYEDALSESISIERSNIVKDDKTGGYYYAPSYMIDDQKYYSSIDDATNVADYFAELAVQRRYIDFTEPTTFYTLREEDIEANTNLRNLHIVNDVFVFGDGQKELMIDDSMLPIINDKPAYFVDPNGIKDPVYSPYEFVFINDVYGIDSNYVKITDSTGTKTVDICYMVSVQEQLETAGFTTGKITIYEETIYGDNATYEAYYIEPGVNTTEITISYTLNGEEIEQIISQDNVPNYIIEAETFYLSSISDSIDPYGLVKVEKENGEVFFCMPSETMTEKWTEPGLYTITCINRLGYHYSYSLELFDSNNLVVSFVDDDNKVIESQILEIGNTNIALPTYEKTGYIMDGFIDIHSQETYKDFLGEVNIRGEIFLKPNWIPVNVSLVYYDNHGAEIYEEVVVFGKSYTLIDYDAEEGYEFLGWSTDGETIIEDVITIDRENNIAVVPIIQKIEEVKDDIEPVIESTVKEDLVVVEEAPAITDQDDLSENSSNRGLVVIICIVSLFVLVAIGGLVTYIVLLRKTINKGDK